MSVFLRFDHYCEKVISRWDMEDTLTFVKIQL